jgi:hypothetical protein
MKTFYFQLNGDLITDVIEYAHEGYIPVDLAETQLPAGINGGWYRLQNDAYVVDEVLYQAHLDYLASLE